MRGQKVILQLAQRAFAQGVDQWHDFRIVVTLVSEVLSHMRPVALLDMGVVVLLVGPGTGEEDGLGALARPGHDVMVDELPAVVAVHAQQLEGQVRFHVLQLPQRAMLAAVFQRALLGPVGADVHRVEHPQMEVIERAAAQGHRVHLHPARTFLGPFAANGNALAKQVAGSRAPAPQQRHTQRCQQPIQRARADRQQALPHISVQPTMIRLVRWQPFWQQRDKPTATGLKRREPDRLEDRQQRVGMILARPTQNQRGRRGRLGFVPQGADGSLAMVPQQLDRLGDELSFILPTRPAILPPQLEEHFGFGLLAHKIVHPLGNTDFWRNDVFSSHCLLASGNKTFGADRIATIVKNMFDTVLLICDFAFTHGIKISTMRTKTLLLTAAVSAAGIVTSMAQVFSVNAVGYVNKTIPSKKLALISNPLNAADNSIAAIFKGVPDGTQVYKFNGASFVTATFDELEGKFLPDAAAATTVVPGEGVFVRNGSASDLKITFVGEVPQGTLKNPLPKGLSIRSSIVPQAGTAAELGLKGVDGDQIFQFQVDTQSYYTSTYDELEANWLPALKPLAVGEAFFIKSANASSWNRTFSVN